MIKGIFSWITDNIAELVVTAILLMIMFVLVVAVIAEADGSLSYGDEQAAAACLARGYPDYRIAYEGAEQLVYCVRLEDGTERVVPLNGE